MCAGSTIYVHRGHCLCAQGALSMCTGGTDHVRREHRLCAQGALSMCAGCTFHVHRGNCPCAQGGTVYVHRGVPSMCAGAMCRIPLHPHSPPPRSTLLTTQPQAYAKGKTVHVNSFVICPNTIPHPTSLSSPLPAAPPCSLGAPLLNPDLLTKLEQPGSTFIQ